MNLKNALPFFILLIFSCGPSSETNNGTSNNGGTNNGETNNGTNNGAMDSEMVIRTTMSIDEVDTSITATAMNNDGSEVAIATKNLRTFTERVRIFDTSTGAELREMSDLSLPDNPDEGNIISVENLFWSQSNKLTALQSYRHRFTWDASSGALLEKKAASDPADKCAGNRGGVFHPNFNEVFVESQAFPADNTLCKINLENYTEEVITLSEGPVVQSFVLDTTGEKLWVSFSNPTDENAFSKDIVNTVAYDARTLAPLDDPISTDGSLVVVGDGFFVAQSGLQTELVPGGRFTGTSDIFSAPGGQVLITPLHSSEHRFIALPEGTLIGSIPKDNHYLRSFSGDAGVATVVDNVNSEISIVEIGTRTSTSVIETPEVPSGTLSGTVIIDGVEESLTGNCQKESVDGLGPVSFLALGTSESGWEIIAHSQNRLLYNRYVFTKSGATYQNNSVIAQNLMIEEPTSTAPDDTIQGQGTLFEMEEFEIWERIPDAGHASGFRAIDIVFNGICTP